MNRVDKRQLLAERYAELFALALAMLHDEDDARDAVQEALVKTLTRPTASNPVGYCFQTLRHEAVNIMRRRLRLRGLDQAPEPATDPDRQRLLDHVGAVYNDLPPDQRTIVWLHDVDGYTFDEVAKIAGRPKTTVRRIIAKAHQTMKDKIEPEL